MNKCGQEEPPNVASNSEYQRVIRLPSPVDITALSIRACWRLECNDLDARDLVASVRSDRRYAKTGA
jgi:hypothetical protein